MWIGKFYNGQIAQVGEGSYFCHVKARPPPYIVDLSGTECLGWGQVRPEKAETSSNCSSGPGEQGSLILELYKSAISPKGV